MHTGKFKLVDEATGTTYIERNDKEQNRDHGVVFVYLIKWVDNYTYELRPKRVIKGDPQLLENPGDVNNYQGSKARILCCFHYFKVY